MRTLLVVAAFILSISAAQAQDPAVRSVQPQPAVDPATQSLIDKLKGTGELKRDLKPTEAAPVQTAPAEAKPIEAKPAETKPVDTKAVETKPVETKPVETKAVETKPVEAKPVQAATEAKPEKKRVVVKKGETREQTARRLAEKYGFSLDID
jgi:ribonuclease E